MKNKLLLLATALALFGLPAKNFAQAPTLGAVANYVLFSTNGPLANTGTSQLTGDIGTNNGTCSTFNNVNGVIHTMDASTALCATNLLSLYNALNNTAATLIATPTLGNGQVLTAGAYSITTAASINGTLTFNGQGNPGAVFIIQVQGALATNAGAYVNLINGAQACNVFWQVEGLVTLGAGTMMKGTIVANNAAININAGTVLEGRALSTSGAVSIYGTTANLPLGCGAATLTGPASPTLASTACFALFSSNGAVTNTGNTFVVGDVGTNLGLTTGYTTPNVTGVIHGIPDGATGTAATNLSSLYTYLNGLTYDIQLMAPTLLGNNMVLTPHVYLLNGATTLTDSLYLNAQGNPNAVFVIQVNGAFSTSVNSKIILLNGAQSKNVFWKIDGAVSINTNSTFRGTIVANNAAISLNAGVVLDGRALTTNGTLDTYSMSVAITAGCSNPSPSITTQPTNQTACVGGSASFVVAAVGTGLTYQWRIGTVNLVNGGNVSGATTATLTINPASALDASANYNVVVTGSFVPTVTSTNVTLIINTVPTIITQAVNQTICSGASASFSVNATGTGLTYQWRLGTANFVNGGSISGATSAILTINPVAPTNAGTNYNVVITGACAPAITSNSVSLVVNTSPSITAQAIAQSVCVGGTAIFSVTAIGTGITYQWRNGAVNLVNAGSISGATSNILTINPVAGTDASANYNVVVTGACSPTATSTFVALVVNTAPLITSQATSQTVCAGTSLNFNVGVTGTGLTYQWRKGAVNLTNGGNILGATSAILNINPVTALDAAANYNLVITGACTPTQTSANVSLVITTSPTITAQATSQTVCAGSPVSFVVAASGTGLTYQWRNGAVNLVNAGSISGVTTPVLNFAATTATDASANYNLVISGACSPTATSIYVTLAVNVSPTITTQALSQTICVGSPVNFSVVSAGSLLTYQWRKGAVNLTNAGTISGATSSVLTISTVSLTDAAANYNVVITGACTPTETSLNVSLVVATSPTITSQAISQTVCAGSSVSYSVVANGNALVYQWRKGSVYLTNAGNVSGANSAVLTINPATVADASANYNVLISGACAPTETSVSVALVVNSSPTITSASYNQTVCAGTPVNFSVTAVGTGLTYQWRKGTVNLSNGANISGATGTLLVVNPTSVSDAATNYNVVVSGVCSPNAISLNYSLFINTAPFITAPVVNQEACVGSNVSFSVIANGTALTYQWRKGTVNLVNAGNITGVTTSTLHINNISVSDAASNYNVVIMGTCSPSIISNNASLVVNTFPVIIKQPKNQMAVGGGSASFKVIAIGSGLTYQWKKGLTTLVDGANITGATSSVLTISSASYADTSSAYYVLVSGICAQNVASDSVTLWVCVDPCANATALKTETLSTQVNLFPNPFNTALTIAVNADEANINYTLLIYNNLGAEVMRTAITKQRTDIETSSLPAGAYFYKLTDKNTLIKSGKLISQH